MHHQILLTQNSIFLVDYKIKHLFYGRIYSNMKVFFIYFSLFIFLLLKKRITELILLTQSLKMFQIRKKTVGNK